MTALEIRSDWAPKLANRLLATTSWSQAPVLDQPFCVLIVPVL